MCTPGPDEDKALSHEVETVTSTAEHRECFNFEEEFEKVRENVGVNFPSDSKQVVLKEKSLERLNQPRYDKENTFLMQCVELGRLDGVDYCLKFDGLAISARNIEGKMAADIAWYNGDYVCLLKLLRADSSFPSSIELEGADQDENGGKELRDFILNRNAIHSFIEKADLKSIRKLTNSDRSSLYLSSDNETAISCALRNRQYEIYAYLLYVGAKLTPSDRQTLSRLPLSEQKLFQSSLEEFYVQDENSHVIKLAVSSKTPGEFSKERKDTINRLFNDLNRMKIIEHIMKVLEFQNVDIIFDFESEVLDRVCGANYSKVLGYAVPGLRRAYVGARQCESDDSAYKKVAGTLAHELCHLCMEALYDNYAKPYKAADEGRRTEFGGISEGVGKSIEEGSGVVDDVIKVVFSKEYGKEMRHSELVVRVPHILGMFGESEGVKLLHEQVEDLWNFYSTRVVPDCEAFTAQTYFAKPLLSVEHLHNYRGVVQGKDRDVSPLNESIGSVRESIVPFRNMSIIVTSNVKLSTLHVYHELKLRYQFHLEKQCLFFDSDCFYENRDAVLNAFRCKACRCLVLVSKEKNPGYALLSNLIGSVEGDDGKEVILILEDGCEDPERNWERKVLRYRWRDLNEAGKREILKKRVKFQGQKVRLEKLIDEELASDAVTPEVLTYLMSRDDFEIGDERHLSSSGYDEKLFVKRKFVRHHVDDVVSNVESGSYHLLITGLSKEHLTESGIDERIVQVVGNGEGLQKEKLVAIPEREEDSKRIFDDDFSDEGKETEKSEMASLHWLHHWKGHFYWRSSKGGGDWMKEHLNEESIGEEELLKASHERKDRVVLISDDPGTGKSTEITCLIRKIKKRWPHVFTWRFDFSKYADSVRNPLSLENIKDDGQPQEIIEYFLRVLKLGNPLETSFVKNLLSKPSRIKLFLDGFDEIVPFYKDKALRLLRALIDVTNIQLWITTRNHERLDLEVLLNVVPYSLKPCTPDDQAKFLSDVWKRELKSMEVEHSGDGTKAAIEYIRAKVGAIVTEMERPSERHSNLIDSLNRVKELIQEELTYDGATSREKLRTLRSKIDRIDFTPYAKVLLEEVNSTTKNERRAFNGFPLHLYMLASTSYEENLKFQTYSDRFNFYSDFVEKKIHVYLKDKCKLIQETPCNIHIHRILKRVFLKAHLKISECLFNPDEYPWESLKDKEELKCVHDVGVVTKAEDRFQFVHFTFAEFFLCERLLEMIKSCKMEADKFKEILLEEKYSVVRRFLSDAIQKEEIKETLTREAIERLKLVEIVKSCIKKEIKCDSDAKIVLRNVLEKVQVICDPAAVDKFVNKIASSLSNVNYCSSSAHKYLDVFELLKFCLTEKMLFKLFDEHIERTYKLAFYLIGGCSASVVSEVLSVLERILRSKASHPSRDDTSDTHEKAGNVNRSGVGRVSCGDDKRMLLYDLSSWTGENIFHFSAENSDVNVLVQVLRMAVEFLGEEETKKRLLGETRRINILQVIICYKRKKPLEAIGEIESILGSGIISELFRERNEDGVNTLCYAAQGCQREVFELLLQYVEEKFGGEFLRELLFDVDKRRRSIFCYAARNPDSDTFALALRRLRGYLEPEKSAKEIAKEITKKCEGKGDTVFHRRVARGYPLRDLKFLDSYIGKENIQKLLTKVDKKYGTWLNNSFLYGQARPELILGDLRFVSEVLDAESMKDFLLATDRDGHTFLHSAAMDRDLRNKITDILHEVKGILGDSTFELLKNTRCKNGKIVRVVDEGERVKLELWEESATGEYVISDFKHSWEYFSYSSSSSSSN